MSSSAERADHDFVRFASEEGCPLYFEEFLQRGFQTRVEFFSTQYPGLCCWRGIDELKRSLCTLTGIRSKLPVLLASRSAQLMKLAARLLFMRCQNVLCSDLGWPGYHAILETHRELASRQITEVAVRDAIIRDAASECEVVSLFCSAFTRDRCDGLFLTAVSHNGVRLPIERIVAELQNKAQLKFVVVDGSQAFCHTKINLRNAGIDLYLAGSHKWLGGFHPLGIAFYGKKSSTRFIETIRDRMLRLGDLDDPLLRFTERLERDKLDGFTETVNLAPLLACGGAVHDARRRISTLDDLTNQLRNSHAITEAINTLHWRPALPAKPFQSGILILESRRKHLRNTHAAVLRRSFQREGLAVTTYDGGAVRLSMPKNLLVPNELRKIHSALESVG